MIVSKDIDQLQLESHMLSNACLHSDVIILYISICVSLEADYAPGIIKVPKISPTRLPGERHLTDAKCTS